MKSESFSVVHIYYHRARVVFITHIFNSAFLIEFSQACPFRVVNIFWRYCYLAGLVSGCKTLNVCIYSKFQRKSAKFIPGCNVWTNFIYS